MPMTLDVQGAGRLVDALSKYNKEIYSILKSEIKQAVTVVAQDARDRTPDLILAGGRSSNRERRSAGWGQWTHARDGRDFSWSEKRADRDIKVGVGKTRVRGAGSTGISGRVYSRNDIALAIFSTAGAETPGSRFNKEIIGKWGPIPTINGKKTTRTLGAALISKGPQAADGIDRALERAQSRFGLS